MSTPNQTAADGLGQEFTLTRALAAPRERVFKAWTDPRHLAQWWGPKGFSNPVCDWDVRPGGNIYVVMRAPDGTDYPMGGEFREIVPPERLVTVTGALDAHGNYLFQFLHTLTLAELGGGTQLTLHSRVIQTTPGAGQYLGGFETGMTLSLERLAEHLDRRTDPLVVERTLNAPAALVWQALTTREALSQWSFEMPDFRPEVGCEFTFDGEKDGVKYHHHCRITDLIPQKRMTWLWRYVGHPGDSQVTFDLLAEGARTRLRLTHIGLETFPPGPDFARENFLAGWTHLLGASLPEFLSQTNPPTTSPNKTMTTTNQTFHVQPYLNFAGRCEEALEFYRQALGARVQFLMRFKETPAPQDCPPVDGEKICHVSFQVGQTLLMASDGHCEGAPSFKGFSLSLNVTTVAEAEQFFAALADGGKVQMPLAKTFFSPSFGMVTDRFGVSWMIHTLSAASSEAGGATH